MDRYILDPPRRLALPVPANQESCHPPDGETGLVVYTPTRCSGSDVVREEGFPNREMTRNQGKKETKKWKFGPNQAEKRVKFPSLTAGFVLSIRVPLVTQKVLFF